MVHLKEKIAVELNKVKLIWKELVHNRQPDLKKISDVFAWYKEFLEENKSFLTKEPEYFRDLELIEAQLNHSYNISGQREKRIMLNNAYVGLLLYLSESMDDLKSRMDEASFAPSGQLLYN